MDFKVLIYAIRPYATILTFNKWYNTQKYDYLDRNTFLLLHHTYFPWKFNKMCFSWSKLTKNVFFLIKINKNVFFLIKINKNVFCYWSWLLFVRSE